MAEGFDFVRAPQFVDFTQGVSDDDADIFFDRDEEVEAVFRSCQGEDEEFYSRFESTPAKQSCGNTSREPTLRRSISVGNLELGFEKVAPLCNDVENTDLTIKTEEEVVRSESDKKNDNCRPQSASSGRYVSREHLDKLAQPKRYYSSANNLHGNNYVSFAESVNCFQNKTPTRFRSRPKLNGEPHQPLKNTVPHSPALLTKLRTRPQHIPTREEKEEIEYKKEQKFKIKAHPVNQKVLQGPLKPTVPVQKQFTKPEPFHLTEIPKKVVPPSPKKPQFHAKPAPRITPQKTKEQPKQPTIPQTPSFMKQYEKKRKDVNKCENEKGQSKGQLAQGEKPHRTCPEPFSFELRDQLTLKKKEQQIKKVLEEERKAREFHARPAPKFLSKKHGSTDTMTSICSSGSSKQTNKSQENLTIHFKAKPATVLHKEPFIPMKTSKPLTEINDFHLYTELRAEEREIFEQQKKDKEESLRLLQEEEERIRLQKEAEEIVRIRKEAEHKAQPVKKYKEVIIQPSGKVTQPISPKFLSGKSHNKENELKNNSN